MSFIILFVAAAVLGSPFRIALIRRHPSRWAIFLLLCIFGWPVLGWALALIWSFTGPAGRTERTA